MRSALIINVLHKAIDRINLPLGLIIHLDGGRQYPTEDFRNLLKNEFCHSINEFKENLSLTN